MGLGPLANALVQMELVESHLGALSMNTQGTDDATMLTLLEHGTDYQKEKFLKPLLNGEKRICYSMTEKVAGADRHRHAHARRQGRQREVRAERREMVLLGGQRRQHRAGMARTDLEAPRHKQFSTFLVELPNPGYRIKRNILTMAVETPLSHIMGGGHAEIEIKDLEVRAENLLGGEGNGFSMGQHRLAYGRLRHGMHNVAMAQRALDLATKHITNRTTFGHKLAERQVAVHAADLPVAMSSAQLSFVLPILPTCRHAVLQRRLPFNRPSR
jgi:acyl-CoA dehydrogenase